MINYRKEHIHLYRKRLVIIKANKKEIEALFFRCQLVRNALNQIDHRKLSKRFCQFPYGACGDTSYVLAAYLHELGFNHLVYVLREFKKSNDNCPHAWLEYKDLIIDMTADQFNEHDEIRNLFGSKNEVEITDDKELWYNTFKKNEERHPINFNGYKALKDYEFVKINYHKILECIPAEYKSDCGLLFLS